MRFRRMLGALVALGMTASTLTACGSDDSDDGGSDSAASGSDQFPVSMDHVYGSTEIREKPEKVVTIGWMSHDIVAALGTAPVGVDETWGGDDEGFAPWFRHQVEDELDADMPEITTQSGGVGPDIEKIATLEPDLILAPHSGVTEDEYSKLSDIAPTVAFQEKPWQSGSWQELTGIVAESLGESDKGEELITETEETMAAEAEKYPNLQGTTFAYGTTLAQGLSASAQNLGLYVSGDPRVAFLRELGLVDSPDVNEQLNLDYADAFYGDVSLENLSEMSVDLFLAWSSAPEETTATLENSSLARWDPIREGNYYFLEDEALASATNGPSPLSIQWALDEGFLDDLSDAADGGEVVHESPQV